MTDEGMDWGDVINAVTDEGADDIVVMMAMEAT